MSETNDTKNTGSSATDVDDRRDELISRVIDGEASGADWAALRRMAEADPSVWADITETRRQHEALCMAVDEVGCLAEGVELPQGGLLTPVERFDRRMNAVRAWGGWAAAAAVLLVWFTGLPAPVGGRGSGIRAGVGPGVGEVAELTPEAALERYLHAGRQAGRVLAEVPDRVVLETRPVEQPGGAGDGLEVVYLRQILEREVIDPSQVFRYGKNEFGEPALVPARGGVTTKVSY